MATYKKKDSLCCTFRKNDLKNSCGYDFIFTEDENKEDAKYLCLYLLDRSNKCAFIYGCAENFPKNLKQQLIGGPLHIQAHKNAFENKKTAYDWFLDDCEYQLSNHSLYRTFLLPLSSSDGSVDKVLGIIKTISKTSLALEQKLNIAEGEDPSIVRVLLSDREEEKRKIASVLHDEIGTAAVAINSLLAILKEDIKEGKVKQALADADTLQKAVVSSMDKIKKAVITLRPPQLDDVGLDSAVRNFIETLCSAASIKVDYEYKISDSLQMSESVKTVLFRTVQEALNNVIKHAKAEKVKIRFSKKSENILLTIEDNGIGYKEEKSRPADKLGLLGMKENISYIGGSINIEGKPGKGTKIKVTCPAVSYKRMI